MKNIVLFILVLVGSSCTTTPKSPFDMLISESASMSVENMENRYPYFNVKIRDFYIADEDPGEWGPSPPIITEEMKKESRILKIACKELMLNKINIVRFVVNTPEFADNLRKQQFYSSRNATGPYGTIKYGDPLDSERLIKVVQKAAFYTQVRKRRISFGAAAVGVVGQSLYVASDDYLTGSSKNVWVAYYNKEDWSISYSTSSYYVGIMFHELLHNMGFNHQIANDATYGIHGVLLSTMRDSKWQKKYKKQLKAFQYYQKKYAHLLQKDDIAGQKRQFENRGTDYYSDEIIDVCILNEDGTSQLVKMKNGRIV